MQNGSHDDKRNREQVGALLHVRVQQVLKLRGTSQQLITGINGWALGAFKYSVGLVKWSAGQLNDLYFQIRRQLSSSGMRASRSGLVHLYLPRKLGGRGVHSVRDVSDATHIRLDNYISTKLQWLKAEFPNNETIHRIATVASEARNRVNDADSASDFMTKLRKLHLAELKPLHRAVENAIATQPDVNAELSRGWLAKEQLSPKMEREYFRIKEECVQTRQVLINRWVGAGDTKCRFCAKETETLDHILSSCQALSFTDYKDRHDQVARQVTKVILERFGISWKHEWWRNTLPKSFPLTRDGKEGVLLWDPQVPTVNRLEHNRPDLIVKLPDGQAAITEFTVCRDDSVVERATTVPGASQGIRGCPQLPPVGLPDRRGYAWRCSEADGALIAATQEVGLRYRALEVAKIGSNRINPDRHEDYPVFRVRLVVCGSALWNKTYQSVVPVPYRAWSHDQAPPRAYYSLLKAGDRGHYPFGCGPGYPR